MQNVSALNTTSHPAASTKDDILRVLRDDGSLDPATDPKLPAERVIALYRHMSFVRILDERLVMLQRQGRIGFHVGSHGEEAAIVGSAAAVREGDWLFPCYREVGAALWRGMTLTTYMNNMYGNAADTAKGRQMPDHYTSRKAKFGSVSSPIGTQITQAVGFAWAAKMRRDDLVTLTYFGEGATSSNDFHNGMNFAGVFKAPTIFFCRNNGWAISVPAERQTASATFADKGVAYGMRSVRVDGNDLFAVIRATGEAVARAASGEGPTLIEAMTYRLSGHSTSDDPTAYRHDTEVEAWRLRDPLVRVRRHLEKAGLWNDAAQSEFELATESQIKEAIAAAEPIEPPAVETMFQDVYAELPWHLREQRDLVVKGPRPKKH